MTEESKIKRALISVFDKTGIADLARELEELGVQIISTGGTLKTIRDAGVQAVSVSTFTGFPEIMDGRVKTLHPKIHAGLLCRRDNAEDVEQLVQADSKSIDLVVVNLYPFQQTVAKKDVTRDEVIENIDIGGPTMLRSAAKNHAFVTVVVDPSDYGRLVDELKEHDCSTTEEFRRLCAAKVFQKTSEYDTAIATWFAGDVSGSDEDEEQDARFPAQLNRSFSKQSGLRYGENPHQPAAVYKASDLSGPSLMDAEVLAGKELSYNNYSDLDAALDMVLDFEEPFACLLKHANPCGAATGKTLAEAYKAAYESDPLSAFGCIIGVNRIVDADSLELIHETPFVECVLAPGFTEDALKKLRKKKARRLLALPSIERGRPSGETVYKYLRGGLLVQAADDLVLDPSTLKCVTDREPTEEELASLLFGWKVVKHTKSNAVVLTKGNATVGIGMGQTSRVDSGFMAVKRAGDRAKGSVVASDAFFPMPDGVEVALEAGATAIIQPGGSKGDEAVIETVNKAGATMVFTGARHFKH